MEKTQNSVEKVTDKPKPWPYNASEARDKSAENAAEIVQLLTPVLDRPLGEAELVRRTARAILAAETILRLLEGQGAQTKP